MATRPDRNQAGSDHAGARLPNPILVFQLVINDGQMYIQSVRNLRCSTSRGRHGAHLVHRGEKLRRERPVRGLPFGAVQTVDNRMTFHRKTECVSHRPREDELLRPGIPFRPIAVAQVDLNRAIASRNERSNTEVLHSGLESRVSEAGGERRNRSRAGPVVRSEDSSQAARDPVAWCVRPFAGSASRLRAHIMRRLAHHGKHCLRSTFVHDLQKGRDHLVRGSGRNSRDTGTGRITNARQEFDQRFVVEQLSRALDKRSLRVFDPVGVKVECSGRLTKGGLLRVGARSGDSRPDCAEWGVRHASLRESVQHGTNQVSEGCFHLLPRDGWRGHGREMQFLRAVWRLPGTDLEVTSIKTECDIRNNVPVPVTQERMPEIAASDNAPPVSGDSLRQRAQRNRERLGLLPRSCFARRERIGTVQEQLDRTYSGPFFRTPISGPREPINRKSHGIRPR